MPIGKNAFAPEIRGSIGENRKRKREGGFGSEIGQPDGTDVIPAQPGFVFFLNAELEMRVKGGQFTQVGESVRFRQSRRTNRKEDARRVDKSHHPGMSVVLAAQHPVRTVVQPEFQQFLGKIVGGDIRVLVDEEATQYDRFFFFSHRRQFSRFVNLTPLFRDDDSLLS